MQVFEKGFGCCSFRLSTIVVLLIHVLFYSFFALRVLVSLDKKIFFIILALFLLFGTLTSVYSYTFYTILQHSSSMLTVAIVLFCVESFTFLMGSLAIIDIPADILELVLHSHSMSKVFVFFVGLVSAVFELYCVWILYSYKMQFRRPVQVNV